MDYHLLCVYQKMIEPVANGHLLTDVTAMINRHEANDITERSLLPCVM